MWDMKFAACLSVCLFWMHLLRNCWTELAKILLNDGGLPRTLNYFSYIAVYSIALRMRITHARTL